MSAIKGGNPIPSSLAGTLAVMGFRRRAGEWDLELTRAGAGEIPEAEIVGAFETAFPWARFEAFSGDYAHGKRSWSFTGGESLKHWLGRRPAETNGFEATMMLRLAWRGDAGEEGDSWLPGTGRLQFVGELALVFLTIWPNLFTDEVPLYEATDHGYCLRLARWERAAASNRARLYDSLKRWEQASGGRIMSWESELVEGVYRHGFLQSARSVEASLRGSP